MTLARTTARLESPRLVLRRIAPADLPFFTRIHAIADVVRYTGHGRPRSAEETKDWLQATLTSYEQLELGQLAVERKSDGMLLGRCGMSDMVIEANAAAGTIPRAWFGRAQAPAGLAVIQERELGYTFDTAQWGHGYATEAAQCVFAYARDTLRLEARDLSDPWRQRAIPEGRRTQRPASRRRDRCARPDTRRPRLADLISSRDSTTTTVRIPLHAS